MGKGISTPVTPANSSQHIHTLVTKGMPPLLHTFLFPFQGKKQKKPLIPPATKRGETCYKETFFVSIEPLEKNGVLST